MRFFFILIFAFSWNTSFAAMVTNDKMNIYIRGTIEPGDAFKVAEAINRTEITAKFFVNSKGGSVTEAIKIAALIERSFAGLMVERGGICASACFLLFISATERHASAFIGSQAVGPTANDLSRGNSYVGIHRPHFAGPPKLSKGAIDNQNLMMSEMRDYLIKKTVPQYLIEEMMQRPSNEVYWLERKDLDAIGEYNPGFEEILIKKCSFTRDDWKILNDQEWKSQSECIANAWFDTFYIPQMKFHVEILRELLSHDKKKFDRKTQPTRK